MRQGLGRFELSQMNASPGPAFGLEDIVEIVERRVWWLVIGAILGIALGVAAYFLLPPRYEASTTILVEPQRVPENYVQSTITFDVEQRLRTLHERVTSDTNLGTLIETVGVDRLDPSGELELNKLMNRIANRLEVQITTARGNSQNPAAAVFEIIYSDGDAVVVADVVREVSSLFITENIKDRAQQAQATSAFLDRELERLGSEVTAQEERIRVFRLERMGELPSQLESNLRTLDRLNLELVGSLEGQESITSRIALLRRQVGSAQASAAPHPLQASINSLRQELLTNRRIYTDEHPNVTRLQEEIAALEAQLASTPGARPRSAKASAVATELAAAELELEGRQRQELRIREQIADMQARVERTPQRETELQKLTRDYENLTTTYRELLSKKYDAALARNLEAAQQGERFKVLRPAKIPQKPVFPDLLLFLPGGLVLGLALTGGIVGLLEFRNPAFRSVNRLAKAIGLPVFASIPRIDKDEIFETPPTNEIDPKLVVHTAPESAPAEQYRGFLPTFLEHEDCRVILVTSAARGDGKSLTCMNLALSLAGDLNKKILVMDGDLRRPKVHTMLRVNRRKGLSNILKREMQLVDCEIQTKIKNVTVLPSGPTVRNPLALLTDKAFLDVLDEARARYDVIMIDAPPLLPVVDSKIMRRMADMVLFVVRADATPREVVTRSLVEMRDVAGVIFNEVSAGSFKRYYHYDAYARYAYGDEVAGDETDPRG